MARGILKSRTISFDFGSRKVLTPIVKLELLFPIGTLGIRTEGTGESVGREGKGENAGEVEGVEGVEEVGEVEVEEEEELIGETGKGQKTENKKRNFTLTK
jgi:hypothetical protein